MGYCRKMYNRTNHRWQYGASAFHAGYFRLQTHSEYVISIAFPLQQRLNERTSMLLYTYIACLVTITYFSYTQQFLFKFFHLFIKLLRVWDKHSLWQQTVYIHSNGTVTDNICVGQTPLVSQKWHQKIQRLYSRSFFSIIKRKSAPSEACIGPEGSRKLRFPDFMTTQGGGEVVSITHRPLLSPGNSLGTHIC